MKKPNTIIFPHLCGVNVKHKARFTIDRPCDPFKSCLILCFHSDAGIMTVDGIQTAHAGDCIIHSPDYQQYHFSMPNNPEGYCNDWLHVEPEAINPVMQRLCLPYNTLLETDNALIINPYIKIIQQQLRETNLFTNLILQNLVEGLLLAIAGKYLKNDDIRTDFTACEKSHYREISRLRRRFLDNCCDDWDVTSMAREVNLSPERFSALYRKFFKKSPYAELIEMRLVESKRLLVSTSMPISEIAENCIHSSLYYFSRLFKKKTGKTPTEYRKRCLS